MTWNKNTEPKSTGWYLCTIDEYGKRWVMPLARCEYPKGHFHWHGLNSGKVVACVKFPKPYEGEPR